MATLIKNVVIVSPPQFDGYSGKILIQDGIIAGVYSQSEILPIVVDEEIDARGKVVLPGLVNAHMHSNENMFRGFFDGMPLEEWMLYSYSPLGFFPMIPRLVFLMTLLGAIELIKSGVTAVQDDVSIWPNASSFAIEGMDAVFEAYRQSGMRVLVGTDLVDLPWDAHFPVDLPDFLREKLPPPLSFDDQIALVREIYRKWHGVNEGKIGVMIAPSAPQRVSAEAWQEINSVAESLDLRIHTHLLETRVQRMSGHLQHGMTYVEFLDTLDLLSNRLTVAHGVWVDSHDIDRLARNEVTVVHNPVSNLKLGSGVMPFQELRLAGVNVALGTDGMSSNDSLNMFETMKFGALIHKVTTPYPEQWPTAEDMLQSATIGGGFAMGMGHEIGEIGIGKHADLVFLDPTAMSYSRSPHWINRIVYSEQGQAVSDVMIHGRWVYKDKRFMSLDENAIRGELDDLLQTTMMQIGRHWQRVEAFRPYMVQLHERAIKSPIAINRLITQMEGL